MSLSHYGLYLGEMNSISTWRIISAIMIEKLNGKVLIYGTDHTIQKSFCR